VKEHTGKGRILLNGALFGRKRLKTGQKVLYTRAEEGDSGAPNRKRHLLRWGERGISRLRIAGKNLKLHKRKRDCIILLGVPESGRKSLIRTATVLIFTNVASEGIRIPRDGLSLMGRKNRTS